MKKRLLFRATKLFEIFGFLLMHSPKSPPPLKVNSQTAINDTLAAHNLQNSLDPLTTAPAHDCRAPTHLQQMLILMLCLRVLDENVQRVRRVSAATVFLLEHEAVEEGVGRLIEDDHEGHRHDHTDHSRDCRNQHRIGDVPSAVVVDKRVWGELIHVLPWGDR